MTRPRTRSFTLAATALMATIAGLPTHASGQSAQEIVNRAIDGHGQRLASIQDVTIRQEVMGITMHSYMVKEEVDGRAFLQPRSASVEGMGMGSGTMTIEDQDILGESWSFFEEASEHWVLEGTGAVEGRDTWRLSLADFDELDWDPGLPGQEGEFEPTRMRMELDQELLVPLEVEVEGNVTEGGETNRVSVRMAFQDYREVEGYLHPFLTVMDLDLGEANPAGGDARQGLEELRRQLEQMPEAQREMMEQMMGEQIRMLENMLTGEGIQMELRVLDLKVNTGPPPA